MRFFLASLILLLALGATAMDVQVRDRMPGENPGDVIIDDSGKQIRIPGPWVQQSINIANDNPTFALEINAIRLEASCMDQSETTDPEVYAAFDLEDMSVTIPAGGPSFDTGEIYIYGLPKCRNSGHIIVVSVDGTLVDQDGDYVDWDESSTVFITQ